jgi:hypothetical protein
MQGAQHALNIEDEDDDEDEDYIRRALEHTTVL